MANTIVLELGDVGVPFEITKADTVESPHTGRTLTRITGEIKGIREEQHDELAGLLDARQNVAVQSVAPGVEPDKQWRVRRGTYASHTPPRGPTIYDQTIEMEEYETHEPTRLVIGGLALRPYEYKEDVSDRGFLDISAKIQIDADDEQTLQKLIYTGEKYYDVVRDGLSDRARRMRFGQTIWSKHEGGNKYQIKLVEDDPDAGKMPAFLPELSQLLGTVAVQHGVIRGLQTLLVAKGVATQEELDGVVSEARDTRVRAYHQFFLVDDIDQYL